jgi:murein DD-endopeptidase MepM/ murein hydrolase activator NlpD
VHYYAHLNSIEASSFQVVTQSSIIGTVGDSGNAAGKPPHLHYSIATLIPYPWRIDDSPHGIWKMICLNPIEYLRNQ